MSVKPILFNTDMVRAILDGRKTVTRRVAKPQPMIGSTIYTNIDVAGRVCAEIWGNGAVKYIKQPYHRGDILWVRETWAQRSRGNYLYRAAPHGFGTPGQQDETMRGLGLKWHPSIHMPREAARIWLRVTDVRVERLQDISEEDAKKEGIKPRHFDGCSACGAGYPHYPECDYEHCGNYQNFYGDWRWIVPFAELWDSTINLKDFKKYGWGANPWVWVIAFERGEMPEGEK